MFFMYIMFFLFLQFLELFGEKFYGENSLEFYEEIGLEYFVFGFLFEDIDSDEEKDCEKITNEEIYLLKGIYRENYKKRYYLF